LQIIIKALSFIVPFLLVFISFALAGSGQDLYFYAGCGFGLAGILVFMILMRPKKENITAGAGLNERPENTAGKPLENK